jgi:hypothetical protein
VTIEEAVYEKKLSFSPHVENGDDDDLKVFLPPHSSQ